MRDQSVNLWLRLAPLNAPSGSLVQDLRCVKEAIKALSDWTVLLSRLCRSQLAVWFDETELAVTRFESLFHLLYKRVYLLGWIQDSAQRRGSSLQVGFVCSILKIIWQLTMEY